MTIRGRWTRGVVRSSRSHWGPRIYRNILSHSDEPFMLRGLVFYLCLGHRAYLAQSPYFWRVSKAKIARRAGIEWHE